MDDWFDDPWRPGTPTGDGWVRMTGTGPSTPFPAEAPPPPVEEKPKRHLRALEAIRPDPAPEASPIREAPSPAPEAYRPWYETGEQPPWWLSAPDGALEAIVAYLRYRTSKIGKDGNGPE